jgi:arabinogalactan oligomer/maltooligosaccharide transport system substrate-binding protein
MPKKHMTRLGTVLLAAVAVALLYARPGGPGCPSVRERNDDQDLDRPGPQGGGRKTVQAGQAPDVIVAAHDWTGQLAADGLVLPLVPKQSVLKLVPKYARDAFSYGTGTARLYGMPTTLENVGLFVNTRLVKVPKTWAQLEKAALAFKRKSPDNLAIPVQQGAGGDAYHMYPFFSGLCGYVFGKTKGGSLNPSNIGLGSRKFLKNASLIDKWNRERLITSKVDSSTAQNAFLKGQAAFWVTGPWNIDTVRKAGIQFRIIQGSESSAVPFRSSA